MQSRETRLELISAKHTVCLVLLLLGISGCEQKPIEATTEESAGETEFVYASEIRKLGIFTNAEPVVKKVRWDDDDAALEVAGKASTGSIVSVVDPTTQVVLGITNVGLNNNWELEIQRLTTVPCIISVEANGTQQLKNVQRAPERCVGTKIAAIDSTLSVNLASWQANSGTLDVAGIGAKSQYTVHIFDAINATLLGSKQATGQGDWTLTVANVKTAPCKVTAISDEQVAQAPVTNAPASCTATDPISNLPGANQFPNSTIISPSADLTIRVGDTVEFLATGFDPDNNTPLTYLWDMWGTPEIAVQNPGIIVFDQPGVYPVELTVVDAAGTADPTPDRRVIVVEGNPQNNSAPDGTIISPVADQVITIGQLVSFSAVGTDAENDTPLSYLWDFAGAAESSTIQNPGTVTFSQAGTYVVKLTVTDSLGNVDPTPDQRVIQVQGNPQNSGVPEGTIVTPTADLTIGVGQSVEFTAVGSDPEKDVPLSYLWHFGGAAEDSTTQNPGTLTFSQLGTFVVTLTVTDSLGNTDPIPATRTITVTSTNSLSSDADLATIVMPSGNVSVEAGSLVYFMSESVNANVGDLGILSYAWDFDGAESNMVSANPGGITFTTPGVYRVTLTVTSSNTTFGATVLERVVTVN